MNTQTMFYVFDKKDCELLQAQGFKLMQSIPEKDVYLFLNDPSKKQVYSSMKVKFTKQLWF